jgi:alanyl-tRNA synthetase
MKTNEIRQAFLNYFEAQGHTTVPSSSLVPNNDPTLLFTNAGMVQFKNVFLGLESLPYTRATSSQRCVRAGGKHNDLENVGYTARHHTFFEMLGNFSFGDYFKKEAIYFAWKLLTEVFKLPPERLWVTVYKDDQEAEDIWLNDLKVDATRFSRCGEKDNFWSMGDTGPCGPCTEIFYDHGPDVAGGPPGSPDEDGDRYVEIWNLVFMQYDRAASGELSQLPKPSVDTGMGLERIAAVLQGVHSNYEIDLFQHLLKAIRELAGHDKDIKASQVIADHIRSTAFLIIDGVTPSNEGRGYVLRRIIRRAVRHGHQLGLNDAFFYKLVAPLGETMGEAYPELLKERERIERVIKKEEQQFAVTLEQGLQILEQSLQSMTGDTVAGDIVFKLYDTYGFPVDLTADIAREKSLKIDEAGFEQAMAHQRQQSRANKSFASDYAKQLEVEGYTPFEGYESLELATRPVQIFGGEAASMPELPEGSMGIVVLERSPFYAESGGQVGDQGVLSSASGSFIVEDTQKQGDVILHYGRVDKGSLKITDDITASVDADKRQRTMLNHTATHLLHAALRQELGEHVIQKGSLVAPDRLRFDFAHYESVTPAQLQAVEQLVNQKIRENLSSHIETMSVEAAKNSGAIALFGEKYTEEVRVLSMGDFSKELCGGTHAERTGDIGFFKIIGETGIAAGIRRIEALTGEQALQWAQSLESRVVDLSQAFKTEPDKLIDKCQQSLKRQRELEKQVQQLQAKLASGAGTDLASQAVTVGDVKVLAAHLPGVETKALRDTLDQLKNKLQPAVVVLVGSQNNAMQVVAGVSKDIVGKVPPAKDYVVAICGKGGGRADMAQGGGALPKDLDKRLASIQTMVAAQ